VTFRSLKYSTPFIVYVTALHSFTTYGWSISLPLILSFVCIPFLELFIAADSSNLDAAEEELARQDATYDFLLYLIVPLQYSALFIFLFSLEDPALQGWEKIARTAVMGLLCGSFGINVGHELGHRSKGYEKLFAKMLLLTSMYMHFFIEHNKGHHKNVATHNDPGSARFGESLYHFFLRAVPATYLSAWKIANSEMKKQGLPALHIKNEMLQFQLIQILFLFSIYYFFGAAILLYFIAAAVMGFLLLETVNYIEHYGLERKLNPSGLYERAMPWHSWNSNQVIGRLILFELSRHSDHHYLASRKYQLLRHHSDAPQMPTGYPGMMILALFPPAWFRVMNKRIDDSTEKDNNFSAATS
jgi:alkane 1-monooxygenase